MLHTHTKLLKKGQHKLHRGQHQSEIDIFNQSSNQDMECGFNLGVPPNKISDTNIFAHSDVSKSIGASDKALFYRMVLCVY